MKISFLVTYYNQENYVRQSLDSILAISKPLEWEILVGDDGSSDKTIEVVNEYIKLFPDQIKLFVMPREKEKQYDPVKRASANRLNLLSHCTGDCFCTLDGDDFYCDTKFVKDAIEVFEQTADISLVMFGYRFYKNGKLGEERLLPAGVTQRVDTAYYISKLYLPAGAGVHRFLWDKERTDYIKKIGYFDDNDIVMNSLNYGDMYYINRSIYAYRQAGESIYTSMSKTEQAILNVQGYDVDKKLIDSSYDKNLILRNAIPILTAYLYRNELQKMLGKKYQRYLESCAELDNSLSYKLLQYKKINEIEKREVREVISTIRNNNPVLFWKQKAKYILKGIAGQ